MPCKEKCEYNSNGCRYERMTGCRRPCGAGKQCHFRISTIAGFSDEDIMSLYEQGFNDVEIGSAICLSTAMVFKWRRKYNLPPNSHGGRRAKWDASKAMELYLEGKSDQQIALRVGVKDSVIFAWRKRNRLMANFRRTG